MSNKLYNDRLLKFYSGINVRLLIKADDINQFIFKKVLTGKERLT